jgi:hypothetical protein
MTPRRRAALRGCAAASSAASIALLSRLPASLHPKRPSHPADEQHLAKPSYDALTSSHARAYSRRRGM